MRNRPVRGRPTLGLRVTAGTQKVYDQLHARTTVSPRVAMATRMYATGAAPTKKAAAEAMGLSPQSLYIASTKSPAVQKIMDDTTQEVSAKAISISALLTQLSRRAVETIAGLMDESEDETIRLKAAQDLADRGPETSKIQRHQVESFTLHGKDVDRLAAAMLEGHSIESLKGEVQGDYEQVSVTIID